MVPPQSVISEKREQQDDQLIEQLIIDRNTARAEKDWAKADEIRDKFNEMGIVLEDKDGKTTWRRS